MRQSAYTHRDSKIVRQSRRWPKTIFQSRCVYLAGLIGNILEHYDSALFACLAPFIAPLFFHNQDPFTALILTYAMIPLGMMTRPVGAFCFGWVGDRFGRREAMCSSLLGMAVATALIGCLPTSEEIGSRAPVFLALLRLAQSFFAAGETAGGAIYVLENVEGKKRTFTGSLYDVSTIVGIMIASALVTLLSHYEWVKMGWRFLFWGGALSGLAGIVLRFKTEEGIEFRETKRGYRFKELYQYKRSFLAIVLAAGFSYTTYSMAFTLMNGYIPLVTSISKTDVMKMNTALLAFDMVLLPLFGFLAHRFGKEKIMALGCISSIIGAIPLFSCLEPSSSIWTVVCVRSAIVASGVAFAAPYHAWAMELAPPQYRSTLLCFGYTVGSQLIGSPSASFSLALYQQTKWVGAPALYLMLVALGAWISIGMVPKKYELPQLIEN